MAAGWDPASPHVVTVDVTVPAQRGAGGPPPGRPGSLQQAKLAGAADGGGAAGHVELGVDAFRVGAQRVQGHEQLAGDLRAGEVTVEPAQDLGTNLGKIVRLNDDGSVPADNPFVGREGALPEIWSYGLRNPWSFQFDPKTGDMYIADIGQKHYEEVNFEPRGKAGVKRED